MRGFCRAGWALSGLLAVMALVGAGQPAAALSWDEARHLLGRTGFAPSQEDIQPLLPLSRDQAVDSLLAGLRTSPTLPPPAWTQGPVNSADNSKNSNTLAGIWYSEMMATTSPLTERLVLLWHGHFTSGLDKVSYPVFLYNQTDLFRRNAGGNFGNLLHAVARDPAMLLYLDSNSNHAKAPNENFARELMELFTLGQGHYSETDVREAARAFTGWHVDLTTGQFSIVASDHDNGKKTFLGYTGAWTGDDILTIILWQPAAATFIATEFWQEFVAPVAVPGELTVIADIFRNSGYDLRALLRATLLTPSFWDPANRGVLVKSPTEYMIGIAKTANLTPTETAQLAATGGRAGQILYRPPNVAGWPGYTAWVDTQSLLVRAGAVETVMGLYKSETLPALLKAQGLTKVTDLPITPVDVAYRGQLLLPLPPVYATPTAAPGLVQTVTHLLHDPAFNLK